MTTDMKFELIKFDGKNYTLWKDMLDTALTAKGLLGYTDGKIPRPTVEDQVSEWLKKDAEARLYIKISVSDAYKPLLLGCGTSKEAIDKLSQAYDVTSEIAKQTLWQKFFEHSMSPRQSMASYLASIELLAKQLRDGEETVSDTCITTQILRSLPDKYRGLRQSFKMLEPTRKTTAVLTEMLLQEDAEFTTREEGKAAAFKANARAHQQHTHKRKTAGQTVDGKVEATGGSAGKFHCWTCGQQGHLKRECPKRKQRQSKTETARDKGDDSIRQAFSSTTAGCETSDHFLADSAASMHMCKSAEFYLTLWMTRKQG